MIRDIPYRRWIQKQKVIKRLKFYASFSSTFWRKNYKNWFDYIGTDVEFSYKKQTACRKIHKSRKKRYKNKRHFYNREWKKTLYHILYTNQI